MNVKDKDEMGAALKSFTRSVSRPQRVQPSRRAKAAIQNASQ